MAKYIFTKDFSTNGKPPLVFKKGDIIEATFDAGRTGKEGEPAVPSIFINVPTGGQFRLPSMDIVAPYTGSSTETNRNVDVPKSGSTPFVWTPMKKVVGAVLAIGAVLGILKLTKVI